MNLQYILNYVLNYPLFRGSLLSYYNFDFFSTNTNAFLFYILFSLFLFLFCFFLFKQPTVFKFIYRRYCRFSYKSLRFLFNSFFLTNLLHSVMLFCLHFYFFLYGRGNEIGSDNPKIRSYSTDASFVDIFFSGRHLFSINRLFFLSVLHDLEIYLSDLRDEENSNLDSFRPFFRDIIDKILVHSGISRLISDYSQYGNSSNFRLAVFFEDYIDPRLISFFDFSYYFKSSEDFRLFLFLLDLLYFDYPSRFSRDLDYRSILNLLRRFLNPVYYSNFFRYVIYCHFHYFSFYSRDFFLLFLFSIIGFIFHYLFFIPGFLVLLLFFFYGFSWHFSFVFILPFFFGLFGFLVSFIVICGFLMFRLINSFFYLSPFWVILNNK